MKEKLLENDDTIYQIYGTQTKKNRIKEFENVIKKKDTFNN